jgi:uncharacterized protein involved in outer membrane biogenesis
MQRQKVLISAAAIILLPVLVITAGLVYISTADLSKHRDFVAQTVTQLVGRRLSLDGELDLNLSMTPSIVVSDIALANAPWASEPEMLTIERVEAEIELLPLLRGNVHIPRFHVEGVNSLVETSSDGVSNWMLAKPGDAEVVADEAGKAGELKLPWIGDAFIGEVEFTYHDGQSGQRVTAKLDHARLSAAGLESPSVFDIVGQVNNNPVEINGKLAVPDVLMLGSMDFPLELHATVLDVQADASGIISGTAESPAIELSVQVNAANLNQLRQVFGDVVPEVQPVKLDMQVKGDQGQPVSFKLNAVAGKGKLGTQLSLRRDGPRPNLTGSVDISDVDVIRLWAPLFTDKPSAVSATNAQVDTSPSVDQFEQPIALDWLEGFDADVQLSTKNINLPQLHIKNLQSRFIVDDRNLKLDGLKLITDAGSVMADLLVNARGQQPELQLDLSTTDIALGKLQPLADNERLIRSSAKADIALSAHGETVAGLIESLQGDAQLDYNNPQRKEKLSLKLESKPEEKTARPGLVVAADGLFDGHAIELSGNIIPPAGVMTSRKPYTVDLVLRALGVSARVNGTVADPYSLDGLDLGIEAHAANLVGLQKAFGKSVPTVGKTVLSTHVSMQQSKLRLSRLQLGLGDGRIAGWLELDTSASIPDLQADLTFTDLDVDKLLPAPDQPAGTKTKSATSTTDDKIFSDEPLPFESLSQANVKATLRANNLMQGGRRIKQAEVKIDLSSGKLTASLLKLASVQGELEGELVIDAGDKAVPSVMIKLKAPQIETGELLAASGSSAALEGPLAADIFLQGQGNSVAQLMATLDGHVNVLMENGSADAEALDIFVGGLSALVGTMFADQSSKTRINCAICDLTFRQGILTPQLAVLDTQYSTVFAEGQVDLKQEQLDIKVSPQSKGVTLSVAFPVRLHGKLGKPGVEVEKTGALLKAGELWATVVYPPAALVKFTDLGDGKQNPCVTMVAEKAGIPLLDDVGKVVGGAVRGTEGVVKEVGGAVKGVGSGLGKFLDKAKSDPDSAASEEGGADGITEEEDDFDWD